MTRYYEDSEESEEEGPATSSELAKPLMRFAKHYNKDEMVNCLRAEFDVELDESIEVYMKMKSVSEQEAEAAILDLCCKTNYLDRTIALYGDADVPTLFSKIFDSCAKAEVESPFGNEEELQKFLIDMNPLFIYSEGIIRPQNTSYVFRILMQEVAGKLKNGDHINEETIEKMADEICETGFPRDVNPGPDAHKTNRNFRRTEIFTDFQEIESIPFRFPWFDYDKQKNELILAPNADEALALWLTILIPQLDTFNVNRSDRSRTYSSNARVAKSSEDYLRTLVCGEGIKDYRYACSVRKPNDDFSSFDQANGSFISVYGHATPNKSIKIMANASKTSEVGKEWLQEKKNTQFSNIGKEDEFMATTRTEQFEEQVFDVPNCQDLFSSDLEKMRFRALREAITSSKNTNNLSFDEIWERFTNWQLEKEAERIQSEKVLEEKMGEKSKEIYSESAKAPEPIFEDVEQIKEFLTTHGYPFMINRDNTVTLSPMFVHQAIDNIRGILSNHPEGIKARELEKICKENFGHNKIIATALKMNKFVQFMKEMRIVEQIPAEEEGGDITMRLKEDFRFPSRSI